VKEKAQGCVSRVARECGIKADASSNREELVVEMRSVFHSYPDFCSRALERKEEPKKPFTRIIRMIPY